MSSILLHFVTLTLFLAGHYLGYMSSFRRTKHHKLWATTAYQHYKIRIFINNSTRFRDQYDGAVTDVTSRGERIFNIELSEETFKDPVFFENTLIHEFMHVLESCNPPDAFSPKLVDGCTALARTVGHGLAQMLRELRQVTG